MIISQKYELIRIGLSEKIIAGSGKYKDRKNILECPSNLLLHLETLGYE